MSVNRDAVRLIVPLDERSIVAQCMLPTCGWKQSFSQFIPVSVIDLAIDEHPCNPMPCSRCGHVEHGS